MDSPLMDESALRVLRDVFKGLLFTKGFLVKELLSFVEKEDLFLEDLPLLFQRNLIDELHLNQMLKSIKIRLLLLSQEMAELLEEVGLQEVHLGLQKILLEAKWGAEIIEVIWRNERWVFGAEISRVHLHTTTLIHYNLLSALKSQFKRRFE